jgi:hypothetical protein
MRYLSWVFGGTCSTSDLIGFLYSLYPFPCVGDFVSGIDGTTHEIKKEKIRLAKLGASATSALHNADKSKRLLMPQTFLRRFS